MSMCKTFKKWVQIFCVVLMILLLFGCSSSHTDLSKTTDAEDIMLLKRIGSPEEFYDISTGYIYFGRNNCSTCLAFLPVLNNILSDEKIVVYYFDTGFFRENSLLEERELQALFSDYQVTSVPIILHVDNGCVVETFTPNFNKNRDNIADVQKSTKDFLLKHTQ